LDSFVDSFALEESIGIFSDCFEILLDPRTRNGMISWNF